MTPSTLKPRWAISLWIIGDTIHAELPSIQTEAHPHTIKLPATVQGIQRLLAMLRSRNSDSSFNTKGDPTQWVLDRTALSVLIKAYSPKRKPKHTSKELDAATEALRKVGII